MNLDELNDLIRRVGGGENALGYAEALLQKVNRLEAAKDCEKILAQFCSSRQEGDFRGRVLEVNFVDAFSVHDEMLSFAVRQGGKGDVDVCWPVASTMVFVELKHLGQAQALKRSINDQLDAIGHSTTLLEDDKGDIARIQMDLWQKASTSKFDPRPQKDWINLIGIDVTELQLGMADVCDCFLAAGGNSIAVRYCGEAAFRRDVVGFFESVGEPTKEQGEWIARVHRPPEGQQHPRDYIHGVLFLFREPSESAALSYELRGVIVWNGTLVAPDTAMTVEEKLARIIPKPKP